MRPRSVASIVVLASAGFLALTSAVAAGAFTWLDEHAVRHWMPGLSPGTTSSLAGLVVPTTHRSDAVTACDLWTYPAAVVPSALLVGLAAWALERRGRRREALLWCAAYVVGNLVEVVGKAAVERPALTAVEHGMAAPATVFDHSLPSGHAIRALLVAAAVARTWPRLGLPAGVWAVIVLPLLVVVGAHTPTDVVAGTLVAAALVAAFVVAVRPARAAVGREAGRPL